MKIELEGSVNVDTEDQESETLLGIIGNYVANQTVLKHGIYSAAVGGKKPCSCQDEEGDAEAEDLSLSTGLRWTRPHSGYLTGSGVYAVKYAKGGRVALKTDPSDLEIYCWFKLPEDGSEIAL